MSSNLMYITMYAESEGIKKVLVDNRIRFTKVFSAYKTHILEC